MQLCFLEGGKQGAGLVAREERQTWLCVCPCVTRSIEGSRDKEGEGLHRSTLYTEIHLHLYLLYWYRRPMFIESAKMRKCVLLIRMEGTIICRSIGCHGTSRSLSHLSLYILFFPLSMARHREELHKK